MIEVEKRVLITKEQFNDLKNRFETQGQFIKDFKRCTLVNIERSDFVPDENEKTDIRVRSTIDSCRLTVKYGDWKDDRGREEYEVDFERDQIADMLKILSLLNRNYYIMTYLHRYQYQVDDFEITLDEYANVDGYLLEVELLVEDSPEEAESKIIKYLETLNLQAVEPDKFVEFVQGMNNILEFRLDLTKTSPQEYYNKLEKYIKCEV